MKCDMKKDEINANRRRLVQAAGYGMVGAAVLSASAKNAIAQTFIDDDKITISGNKLSKTFTAVVGKSLPCDYLTSDYATDDAAIQAAIDAVNVAVCFS